MLDFSEPAVWWYITRSSAIVAWVLLTLSALWGILLKTRILRGADNPEWLKVTHRFLSGIAMLMVLTHMVSLYLDSYIEFTVRDLLVPFATDFEPWGVALGVFGMWTMVLVWGTSMAMQWIPQPIWRAIHFLSYLSLFAVAMHSGMVGTDVGTPWYTALSISLISAATFATLIRIILTRRSSGASRASSSRLSSPPSGPTPTAVAGKASVLPEATFIARVTARREVATDVMEFILTLVATEAELDWEAGSHVTVELGNGLERQYSLTGDPADSRVLSIAVLNTRGPGGGSEWIHQHLQVGMELRVSMPIQAFPLKAHHRYQFIASGIGITPILSMLKSLPATRDWELLYLGRSRSQMAYVDQLEETYPDRVQVWASDERRGRANLSELIDPTAHVYACGSEALLEELERRVEPSRLHLERFVPIDRSSEHKASSLQVTWAPTSQTVEVGADETILDALEDEGIAINASCRRGVCGSCELRVVEGTPAHLDSVMSDADKDELSVMYPCVSRAEGSTLTLSPS